MLTVASLKDKEPTSRNLVLWVKAKHPSCGYSLPFLSRILLEDLENPRQTRRPRNQMSVLFLKCQELKRNSMTGRWMWTRIRHLRIRQTRDKDTGGNRLGEKKGDTGWKKLRAAVSQVPDLLRGMRFWTR